MKKGLSFYISSFAYTVWNRQKERPYDTRDRKIPLFWQAFFFRLARKLIGDYHMLRYRAIERYLCLVLIALCLLTHLPVKDEGAQARAERSRLSLPSMPQLQQRLRPELWDDIIQDLETSKTWKTANAIA